MSKNQTQTKKASTMTIAEAIEAKAALDSLCGNSPLPRAAAWAATTPYDDFLSMRVLVRTATYFLDGTLIEVHPQELVLRDVATVFNLGNQLNLATGKWAKSEAHPKGKCIVGRGAIIDVSLVG